MLYYIGIGGLKRSGKDSFAKALHVAAHERDLAFGTVAFADPVRRTAAAAYDVDVSNFTDDAKKDSVCDAWGITYRQMLINVGEAMRSVDADHWVKTFKQQILRARLRVSKPLRLLVAVPDVRRLNEAAAIHDAGGVNVLVQRPGLEWNGHITETLAYIAGNVADLSYTGYAIDHHRITYNQNLREGGWQPQNSKPRYIFDYVAANDADLSSLQRRADSVLDDVMSRK